MSDSKFALKNENSTLAGAKSEENLKRPVRMMVILNNRKTLAGGLGFLEKRNYQVTVFNKISEAVKQLPILKPHTILLSWNLRNTDVRKAYKILTEKFNLICIVFAEDNTTRTTASLMSCGIPHSLLAPVSGPSIHMRVQALLRSRQNSNGSDKRKKAIPEPHSHQPGEKKSDNRLITGKNFGKVRVHLKDVPADTTWHRVGEGGDGGHPNWEGSVQRPGQDKSEVYFFKGPEAPRFDSAKGSWSFAQDHGNPPIFMEKRPASGPGGVMIEEGSGRGRVLSAIQEGQKGKDFSLTEERPRGKEFAVNEENPEGHDHEFELGEEVADPWDGELSEKNQKELELFAQELAREFESGEMEAEKGAGPEGPEAPEFPESARPGEPPHAGANEAGNREGHDSMREVSPPEAENEAPTKNSPTGSKNKVSFEFENIVHRSAREALEASARPAEFHVQKLQQVNSIALSIIDSQRATGFLLGVSGGGRSLKDFMSGLMDKFWISMAGLGENPRTSKDVIEIPVQPFVFSEWAAENAGFTLVRPHEDDTIGLAFLKIPTFPRLTETDDEKILGVSLEKDMVAGARLLFDVYLHLPKNKKFLLYLNKGDVLSASMSAKLLNFGIQNLFIRRDEFTLFLAYYARNMVEAAKKTKK